MDNKKAESNVSLSVGFQRESDADEMETSGDVAHTSERSTCAMSVSRVW